MRKTIIICALVAMAVTGFGGAASPFAAAPAHAEKKKAAAKSEDPNAPHPDFEYVDMKPLTLPIVGERGVMQQVSLMVSLELHYGKLEEVEPLTPRLADAYLQDLYGALGAGGAMMKGNVIDVAAVKKRLAAVTGKVLGADKVHDVLLQVVQQRQM